MIKKKHRMEQAALLMKFYVHKKATAETEDDRYAYHTLLQEWMKTWHDWYMYKECK